MKTTGEIVQGLLPKVLDGTLDIASEPGNLTPTHSGGSGTGVMIAPGKTRPQPDEVRDILWKLSTIKLWQIKPEDQKDVKNALSALAWATIPATIDEAVYWLTRLIAHFPRRDASKDAVVVSDLAADMFDAGVSLVALVASCDEIRKAATRKDPWFPPSGEILDLAKKNTKRYVEHKKRLESPPRPALAAPAPKEREVLPWENIKFVDMNDECRVSLWKYLQAFGSVSVSRTYCNCLGINYDDLQSFIENRKEGPMLRIEDFGDIYEEGGKFCVNEQLYPESRGWIVHHFPTRKKAEDFLESLRTEIKQP